MQSLINDFLTTGNDEKLLEAIYASREQPYEERNRHFLTSHKLMDFEQCPLFAKMRHIDGIAYPVEPQNDNFLLGSGIEDAIALPEDAFNEQYAVVSRRTEKAEAEKKAAAEKAAKDKAAKEAAEKAAREKAEAEKAEAEKAKSEKLASREDEYIGFEVL